VVGWNNDREYRFVGGFSGGSGFSVHRGIHFVMFDYRRGGLFGHESD